MLLAVQEKRAVWIRQRCLPTSRCNSKSMLIYRMEVLLEDSQIATSHQRFRTSCRSTRFWTRRLRYASSRRSSFAGIAGELTFRTSVPACLGHATRLAS